MRKPNQTPEEYAAYMRDYHARRKARDGFTYMQERRAIYQAVFAGAIVRRKEYLSNQWLMELAQRKAHNRKQREYNRSWCAVHRCWKRFYNKGHGRKAMQCPLCKDATKKDHRWSIKGRESKRINRMLRRHRMRAAGPLTKDIIYRVFVRADNQCECCGARVNLTLDHKIPVSKGGTNGPSNLGVLCHMCNSIKCDRMMTYQELSDERCKSAT